MVRKSLFDLFLFFSIVAILVGIVLIIFIQFDRGYVVSGTQSDADFEQQQNRLIEYLHESKGTDKQNVDSTIPPMASITIVPPESKPEVRQSAIVPQTLKLQTNTNPAPVADSSSPTERPPEYLSYDEYERYWLSQNPWSPDYQPPN